MTIHQPSTALLAFIAITLSSLCNMVILSHSQTPFFKNYNSRQFDNLRNCYTWILASACMSFLGSFSPEGFAAHSILAGLALLCALCLSVIAFNISRKS